MKAFIESQFNYCPLIWMFHSRTMNNKINHIPERVLRLVYLMNYLKKTDHFLFTTVMFKVQPLNMEQKLYLALHLKYGL